MLMVDQKNILATDYASKRDVVSSLARVRLMLDMDCGVAPT